MGWQILRRETQEAEQYEADKRHAAQIYQENERGHLSRKGVCVCVCACMYIFVCVNSAAPSTEFFNGTGTSENCVKKTNSKTVIGRSTIDTELPKVVYKPQCVCIFTRYPYHDTIRGLLKRFFLQKGLEYVKRRREGRGGAGESIQCF